MGAGMAFLLTLLAGLSTGIGGLAALPRRAANQKFLAASLGFSAGVMIYVSLVEIFFKAKEYLMGFFGQKTGSWCTVAAFFGGILLIAFIERLIPEPKAKETTASPVDAVDQQKWIRAGLLTALAIAIHNFPEGLATFISALQEPGVAIPVVTAIAIHNIPEGLAVAVPILAATGSKSKAVGFALFSGLAEPAGALLGYLVFRPLLNDAVFGILFAVIAGIMIFLSFDELLPDAEHAGGHTLAILGLMVGMAVMAISLLLFL